MSHIWYDPLVLRDDVIAELDAHVIDEQEREELVDLIDEVLHHHVLNVVLNHLPQADHLEFMTLFKSHPYDPKVLEFVKSKVTIDIESEITTHASRVKKDLIADIHKSRIKKSK